ncbi:MAG: Tad domain-containing protein [Anaerolineaceae bacterium]|nr:Tad domain-containing protein [Anaerolineaceae bacterium]
MNKFEKGQVLELLVITFTLLIAFTAFAIDGGMIYSDRRYDQNVADSSALAGAALASEAIENETFKTCSSGLQAVAENAAIARAVENGFPTFDNDVSDNLGVTTVCTGNTLTISTVVTAEVDTNFMHFFYDGPVANTVHAETQVGIGGPLAGGFGMVALDAVGSDQCLKGEGLVKDGTPDAEIYGGGSVQTNSCMNINGTAGGFVIEEPGGLFYGTFCFGKCDEQQPPAAPAAEIIQLESKPAPSVCSEAPICTDCETDYSLSPGHYESITIPKDEVWTLEPGIYCVDNGIDVVGQLDGWEVAIYLAGGTFNNDGIVDINAPTWGDYKNMKGMVLWGPDFDDPEYDSDNPPLLQSIGNKSEFYFSGTIFLPSSTVKLRGNPENSTIKPDGEMRGQIIAHDIELSGTVGVKLIYDEDVIYIEPSIVNMVE